MTENKRAGRRMEFRFGTEKIWVNVATLAELKARVSGRFAGGDGFALATLNLDHLVKLAASPGFLAAYQAQDLVVADGNPIVWLSSLAKQPVELIPGSDLVLPLARLAADADIGVALIGSTAGVLDKAHQHLCNAVPCLRVELCLAPGFGFDPKGPEADKILTRINNSGARLCFLALGAPKQEVFAARARKICPGVGFASIGAGLDFLAGGQKRAPQWVRRFALEWLWRALSNPWRLGPRYLRSAMIVPGLVIAALRQR